MRGKAHHKKESSKFGQIALPSVYGGSGSNFMQ
jgi:hypothetical protein